MSKYLFTVKKENNNAKTMEVEIVVLFDFEQVMAFRVAGKVLNVQIQFMGVILGRSGIITINFERIFCIVLVYLLLTLSMHSVTENTVQLENYNFMD